jgi:hypothetical protein
VEVSVRGEREEPSTIHIPRGETQFVAGAFGDPLKIVEVLPGMAPWLSGLPYFYVRGSPPENVGYFIDGIRIPLLFHVGPGASTIAPMLVDSVDLFPGAYPAAYGRYAGAAITAQTTSPEVDAPHGDFAARVYDANAAIEAPIDQGRGSVLAAGRYSYTQLLTRLIVPDYSVGYWDYEARVSHRVGEAGTVTLLAFGAHDELHNKGMLDFRNEYHRVDLRYDHALPGGHVRVAATAQYDDSVTAVQTDTGDSSVAALRGLGGRGRIELDERVSHEARIRAGVDAIVTHDSIDDYPSFQGFPASQGPHTDIEGGAYADVVWHPAHAVEVVPGFRFDGYRTRGATTWAPQPRLATRVQLSRDVAWLSALGTAHQEPSETIFVPSKIPSPIDQSSQTIYQFSEGFDFRLPSSLHARLTGFYSRLVALHLVGTDQSEHGHTEGLEVFLRREFTQRLGGFVSYTLSRTAVEGPNGGEQRVGWDRTHVLSVVLGYDLGNDWRVGARAFVESGRPWPTACVNCSPKTTGAPVFVTPAGNLPWFWRLDVRLEKRWNFRSGAWFGATLECFNTFDAGEPVGDAVLQTNTPIVAPGYPPIVASYMTPIILPSIGVEGGF